MNKKKLIKPLKSDNRVTRGRYKIMTHIYVMFVILLSGFHI